MADERGVAISALIQRWVEPLATLDERRRDMVLRFARLLAAGDSQWTEIIETMIERAEMPE